MARPAHPDAMAASRPSPTRTAPPRMPDKFPGRGRYLSYMLFGATSLLYLVMGLLVLRVTWALGSGADAWSGLQEDFRNPLYLGFHVFAFGVLVWAGWRFLIVLSGKANPPRIGPLPRPPLAAFPPLFGGLWLVASAVAIAVLWGIFP